MTKAFAFVISAVLLSLYAVCEGLECYHCYSGSKFENKDSRFVPCNEANLNASNTWICPSPNARCIYEIVHIESTNTRQTWRACSNGLSDPCDPNTLPPGVKMIECGHCGSDKCNLNGAEEEKNEKNTFTFNINANVNLFIRQ